MRALIVECVIVCMWLVFMLCFMSPLLNGIIDHEDIYFERIVTCPPIAYRAVRVF
jgi:hypothetical protein